MAICLSLCQNRGGNKGADAALPEEGRNLAWCSQMEDQIGILSRALQYSCVLGAAVVDQAGFGEWSPGKT